MRIAFVGHSYHKVTGSSVWFVDLLRQYGHVDVFWSEYWSDNSPDLEISLLADYDRVFVWQVETIATRLAEIIPEKLVFIPMFDSIRGWDDEKLLGLGSVRVVNFCWALSSRMQKLGMESFNFQFFPDPTPYLPPPEPKALHGYFWARRPEISWKIVRQLCSLTRWDSFTIHVGLDPLGHVFHRPDPADIARFNISFTEFSDNRAPQSALNSATVYFSPRPSEGIGMSFLEAMAKGQCVVGVDAPTMSEYITSGVNGLLYDLGSPPAIDFSQHESLGARARELALTGFRSWSFDLSDRFPDALFNAAAKSTRLSSLTNSQTSKLPSVNRTAAQRQVERKASKLPTVTVAMVVRNAKSSFEATLRSICAQKYPAIEIVVVDGASDDGTVDLMHKVSDYIDLQVSEPDEGPYDAMNKAARLASSEYILFMNAGDFFFSENALLDAVDHAPPGADFLIGHHVYLNRERVEELHITQSFEQTFGRLKRGELSFEWLSGIPCHQATITRRETLLALGGYDRKLSIAADHDFMFRAAAAGSVFHHCGRILSIYTSGGLSSQQEAECVRQWWRIARKFGPRPAVDSFFGRSFGGIVDFPWWSRARLRAHTRQLLSDARTTQRKIDRYFSNIYIVRRLGRLGRSIRKRL